MALIACPECARDVSDAAASCPHCGHPLLTRRATPAAAVNKGAGTLTKILLLVFGVFGFLFILSVAGSPRRAGMPTATTTGTAIDRSPAMQAKRLKIINGLIKDRVFHKTAMPDKIPSVWVAPGFYDLSFDDKQSFVSVVYAYYFPTNSGDNYLLIKDSRSGNIVGSFNSQTGLKMD